MLVLITEALYPAASIVTPWVIVNPVLYPPEFCTTTSPPASTAVRAWLNDRHGWTAEHGFASLPFIDTKTRGAWAWPIPTSKRLAIPLPTKPNTIRRVVIILFPPRSGNWPQTHALQSSHASHSLALNESRAAMVDPLAIWRYETPSAECGLRI